MTTSFEKESELEEEQFFDKLVAVIAGILAGCAAAWFFGKVPGTIVGLTTLSLALRFVKKNHQASLSTADNKKAR